MLTKVNYDNENSFLQQLANSFPDLPNITKLKSHNFVLRIRAGNFRPGLFLNSVCP